MKRLAQIRILPADVGPRRRQFGPDERRSQCEQTTDHPRAQNQKRRVHLPRDDCRVHEDARADNAAHDDHGRVEETETPRESWISISGGLSHSQTSSYHKLLFLWIAFDTRLTFSLPFPILLRGRKFVR